MQVVFLTPYEYDQVLYQALQRPKDPIEFSVSLHPHPATDDPEANEHLCKHRTVNYKWVGEPGREELQPLTLMETLTFLS